MGYQDLPKATLLITAMVAGSAQAAIVTDYFASTVLTVNDNVTGISVNDVFYWSMTYDDAGRTMAQYNDDSDGKASRTDGIFQDYCLDGLSGGCSSNPTVYSDFGFTLMSDADFDLSSLDIVTKNFDSKRDVYTNSYSWIYERDSDGFFSRELVADDFRFLYASNTTSLAQWNGIDDSSGLNRVAQITFTTELTSPPVSPVPLPAAAWLFASAIIGAGVVGRRKKKAA